MFMAGRNISVTHIALGSTRVMRTCGMIGEVVGMAASVCMKRNALPRDIYTTYFADLQELMRKGTGRTDVPYTQFYHQVDRTGHQAEAGSGLPACGMTPHAGGSHPSARRLAVHPEPTY